MTNNPRCPDNQKAVGELDLVLITHGHSDPMGDAVEVLEASGALAVGVLKVCDWLGTQGIQNTSPFNVGGTQEVEGIAVTAVRADRTSSIQDGVQMVYGAEAVGYDIRFENWFTL